MKRCIASNEKRGKETVLKTGSVTEMEECRSAGVRENYANHKVRERYRQEDDAAYLA